MVTKDKLLKDKNIP